MTNEQIRQASLIIPVIIIGNTKRALCHSTVCKTLNIPCNPNNIRMIKAIVRASGYREIAIKGVRMYAPRRSTASGSN